MGKEGIRADGLHFDDERLALMRGHAGRLPYRLAAPRRGEVLFVQSVAGFVQHAVNAAARAASIGIRMATRARNAPSA